MHFGISGIFFAQQHYTIYNNTNILRYGTTKARMWSGNDTPDETTGTLSAEIRYMDVRTQQAVPSDGETA